MVDSLVDNGNGTFTITGAEVTDNGNGTYTLVDPDATDNGNGTFALTWGRFHVRYWLWCMGVHRRRGRHGACRRRRIRDRRWDLGLCRVCVWCGR